MRELEVLRVEADGRQIILIDRADDEHFRIHVGDDLRAAVTPAPAESEPFPAATEADLRPREIQARIRAGATVEELATVAGVSASRIERYAHPVLLERARAAELARASHPMGMDGPSLSTLGELVTECLVLRGAVPAEARWDSWKSADGFWVIQVSWLESGTEGYAHWRFHPGSHGGTTEPIDELATELTDPELSRNTRRRTMLTSVRPQTPQTAPPPRPQPQRQVRPDGHEQVTVDADVLVEAQASGSKPVRGAPLADVLDLRYSSGRAVEAPAEEPSLEDTPEAGAEEIPVEDEPYFDDGPHSGAADPVAQLSAAPEPEAPAQADPTPVEPAPVEPAAVEEAQEPRRPAPAPQQEAPKSTGTPRHRTKRGKPAVPAWEDVLLGVRSHPDE